MAGQVGVGDHLDIGSHVTIAAQSGVMHPIDGDQRILGSPAIPAQKQLQIYAVQARLPEMRKELHQLQKAVQRLEEAIALRGTIGRLTQAATPKPTGVRRGSLLKLRWPPSKARASRQRMSKIGLLAGWGELPLKVATALQQRGHDVYCVGFRGHADPRLKSLCHAFRWGSIARNGAHIRFLRRHGVAEATMAGKVFKQWLFRDFLFWRHLPDRVFLRFFFRSLVLTQEDRKDDTLLRTAVDMYQHYGIQLKPATELAPEILARHGPLSRHKPTHREWADIRFGWKLAREMGRLDVGQSVAVKNRAVLSVEAVEGTDACIRRAGELCPDGGFTVVKVAKPQQDMRFDVPTIGPGTLNSLIEAGGRVLAIEAQKTIVLDPEKVAELADRHQIAVIALGESDLAETPALP